MRVGIRYFLLLSRKTRNSLGRVLGYVFEARIGGALAGAVTGVVVAILLLVLVNPQTIEELTEDLLRWQLGRYGIPPEEVEKALEQAMEVVTASLAIAPLTGVIQQTLLGALFGLLKGFLTLRFRMGRVYAALVTGAAYAAVLGAIPLIVVNLLYPDLLRVVSKHLPNFPLLSLVPVTVFITTLTVFSSISGPWTRVTEAKPREY